MKYLKYFESYRPGELPLKEISKEEFKDLHSHMFNLKKRGMGKTKRNKKNQVKRQKQIQANMLVLKKLEAEFQK